VAQLASIAFFLILLAALGVILELTIRSHWAAVLAALKGEYPGPAQPAAPAPARAPLGVARASGRAATTTRPRSPA